MRKRSIYFLMVMFSFRGLSGMDVDLLSSSNESYTPDSRSRTPVSASLESWVEQHALQESFVAALIKVIGVREGMVKDVVVPRMLEAYAQGAVHWAESLKGTHFYADLQKELTNLVDEDREVIGEASLAGDSSASYAAENTIVLKYPAFLTSIKVNLFAKQGGIQLTTENFNEIITRARQILKLGSDTIWACLVLESLWQVALMDCPEALRNLRKLILVVELNDTGLYDFWIDDFLGAGKILKEVIDEVQFNTTALISATTFSHIKIVRSLINAGAQVNKANEEDETPLMMAALLNKVDILNFLLQHKADTKIRNKEGFTAFHFAAYNGSVEATEALVLSDPNIREIIDIKANDKTEVPLISAIEAGRPLLVKLLLDSSANPNVMCGNIPALQFAITLCGIEQGGNAPGRKVNTATYKDYLEIVRLLINNENLIPAVQGESALGLLQEYHLPGDIRSAFLARHALY